MIKKAQIEDFKIAICDHLPVPNSAGIEGHGESCEYRGHSYYYPQVGKLIPRDRISYLSREYFFCGRLHGNKEYIVILPHKTDANSFYVLECVSHSIRDTMKKYKGKKSMEEILPLFDKYESDIKCVCCGNEVLLLDDDQPNNECFSCWWGED